MNNQQAGIIEFCVAKLTKYSSETLHLGRDIIHLVKANKKHTCLTSGDTDSCKEPLGSA